MLFKLFTSALALSAYLPVQVHARSEDHIQDSVTIGGPHGSGWDDLAIVKDNHHRLRKITLSPCEDGVPVSYVKFEYGIELGRNSPITHSSEHGQLQIGRKSQTLELFQNDFVVRYIGFAAKESVGVTYKTRLHGLSFRANSGRFVSCGTQQHGKDPMLVIVPFNYAYLYFSGSSGEYIDSITGHAIPLKDYF